MLSIFTSYLVQARACSLKGIGEFVIITRPAELDIVHKRLLPPVDDIAFTENHDAKTSPGLIDYVSGKNREDHKQAKHYVDNYCDDLKQVINKGEVIRLETLGTLQKNAVGAIFFRKASDEHVFRQPVSASRVIRDNADHSILVGDRQRSTNEMTDYYAHTEGSTPGKKKWWMLWAALLFLLGLIILVIHFSNTGFNTTAVGNQSKVAADSFIVNKISK